MRNVVLIMTASVDGYVVAPQGHAGGLPEPAELTRWKPALNAFAITFGDRFPAAETY